MEPSALETTADEDFPRNQGCDSTLRCELRACILFEDVPVVITDALSRCVTVNRLLEFIMQVGLCSKNVWITQVLFFKHGIKQHM